MDGIIIRLAAAVLTFASTRFVGILTACIPESSHDGDPMTMARRQLRFGAFFSVPGCHPTGWRHPDAICETDLDFRHLADMARMAERGKLDCMFFQDSVAIPGSTAVYGAKPFRVKNGRQAHIEPVSAIAASSPSTTSAAGAPAGTSSPRRPRTRR
jgi:hypothetical protein